MAKDAYDTRYSQAVPHPSTNLAQHCLTWQIGRDAVYSAWYGRRRCKGRISPTYTQHRTTTYTLTRAHHTEDIPPKQLTTFAHAQLASSHSSFFTPPLQHKPHGFIPNPNQFHHCSVSESASRVRHGRQRSATRGASTTESGAEQSKDCHRHQFATTRRWQLQQTHLQL